MLNVHVEVLVALTKIARSSGHVKVLTLDHMQRSDGHGEAHSETVVEIEGVGYRQSGRSPFTFSLLI